MSCAHKLVLKGAMLFVVWEEKTHRPARALDLLHFNDREGAPLDNLVARGGMRLS